MTNASPRLLLVELNEFNPEFIATAARELGLRHFQSILALPRVDTTTDDLIEHQGLDPWVQWVNVHTGAPSAVHGVKRPGATAMQTRPQVWNRIAEAGYSWGAWGVMNAPMGDPKGCAFFAPDPWSFEERAYPEALNDFLALPTYAAAHYLDLNGLDFLRAMFRSAGFFLPPRQWGIVGSFAPALIRGCLKAGVDIHTFTTLIDYLGVLNFTRLKARAKPDFSVVFLNHIAHLQHHFWRAGDRLHPQMEFGLRLGDRMLGMLLASRGADEALVVMNGIRQANVAGKGFFVYRPHNPEASMRRLGITNARIKPGMTNEAHLLFATTAEADDAEALLRACRLSDGGEVFFVEREADNRVFHQLAIEREVGPDVHIIGARQSIPFHELFELICERTGAHVRSGDLYYDGLPALKNTPIKNHDIQGFIVDHFRRSEKGR